MSYEFTGTVKIMKPKQTFASGFTKRDLVLTDDNDVQTKYPNHIAFTFKKDNTALLNNVQKGQRAKVRFAIDGRVWQDPKTGQNRSFTVASPGFSSSSCAFFFLSWAIEMSRRTLSCQSPAETAKSATKKAPPMFG